MNITFLVGNGFDISCGIDTSYSGFYKWYCTQPSASEHIQEFKNNIKEDVENGGKNWSDFEIGLGRYTAKFSVDTVQDFFDCYEDSQESIIEYIQQQQRLYKTEQLNDEQLKMFRNGLLNFFHELYPVEKNVLDSMFQQDINNSTVIRFISFNYSDTLDSCVKSASSTPLKTWSSNGNKSFYLDKKVVHAHGTSELFPIIGVNDESQIVNKSLLEVENFSNIIIKPNSVRALSQDWHEKAANLIDSSKIICIWGMSLGETDATWWEKIMAWLKNDMNRHVIIFAHSSSNPSKRSIIKYLNDKTKITRKLFDYSDFPEADYDSISKRIHIVINTEHVLKLPLLRKTEEELKVDEFLVEYNKQPVSSVIG